MDEFGSRIQHSDEPTVRVIPFCFIPTQTSYSVLFPVQCLEKGGKREHSVFYLSVLINHFLFCSEFTSSISHFLKFVVCNNIIVKRAHSKVSCLDEVTRDYVEGCRKEGNRRNLRLRPWLGGDYTDNSFQQKELTAEFVCVGNHFVFW